MTSGTLTLWGEAGLERSFSRCSLYAASAVGILRVSDPASTIIWSRIVPE
ncbi:hypothetical protein [Methanospirillum lacunae]|nr:hypothetical protein [Methanospirillum lacunae]